MKKNFGVLSLNRLAGIRLNYFRLVLHLMIAGILATGFVVADPTSRAAAEIVQVPSGNRNVDQPPIPYGAISRTTKTKSNFDSKYAKIYKLLSSDRKLIRKIKKSAAIFKIDPIHIIGALVGEHTYNVDALDRMQTYYVKAMAYLGSDLTFKHGNEKITAFVNRPQFGKCRGFTNSYDLWSCRENIWNTSFRGKTVGGTSWPNDRFGRVFFQPLYAGQTFGLGQLNPLTALRVTDLVSKKTRSRKLNPKKAPEIYREIMDPNTTLNYMAAGIRISIDAYRAIAGFDISNNPGLTATLYNLGDVRNRAVK
ncbi:MAG: DUF1402 family protein, partial [Desulfobulbia bacterium]